MSRNLGRRLLVVALATLCLTAAQGQSSKSGTKSASQEPSTGSKTARLPRHFGALVDQQQRQEIYSIRMEYRAQIAALQEELQALKEEEMQAMEKVLTTTQRKELLQLREGAGGARAANGATSRSSSKTSGGKSAASKTSSQESSAGKRSSRRSSAK